MSSIVIGFSRPKGWFEPFSWLIRLITWAPMSHAYIRYNDPYADRNICYQASGLKVNFIGQTMFNGVENVCAEFIVPISETTKRDVIQKAVDKCGSPYNMAGIFGMLWILFMRLFGKKVGNPFYSSTSFWCSELVADILNEVEGTNLDASTMTPKDVYEFMLSKGYKTTQ